MITSVELENSYWILENCWEKNKLTFAIQLAWTFYIIRIIPM